MRKKYSNLYINQLQFIFFMYLILGSIQLCNGQQYRSEVIGTQGAAPLRMQVVFEFTDSLVSITIAGNTSTYEVIKNVNEITYVTDGVKMFEIQKWKQEGRMLFQKFTYMINFKDNGSIISYWCNEIN
jgi:hypothetical protein